MFSSRAEGSASLGGCWQLQVPRIMVLRSGWGWQRGSLAHPHPWLGLSAAVQQLQPCSLPGSWQRECLLSSRLHPAFIMTPSPAAPNPAARPARGMSHGEEQQLAPLLPVAGARGPGHLRGAEGSGVALHPSVQPWLGRCDGWGGALDVHILAKPRRHRCLLG